MEGVRVIQLGAPIATQRSPRTASFEEAFGEYSEVRGRGRDRRAKRKEARKQKKLERIASRDEVKRARVETRQKRRSDRKGGRQQERIERRRARKSARQNVRAEQQAARMARRMERVSQRQGRKDEKTQRELEREMMAAQMQQELDAMYPEEQETTNGYGPEVDDVETDNGYDTQGYAEEEEEDYATDAPSGGAYASSPGSSQTAAGDFYEEDYSSPEPFDWEAVDAEYGYSDEPDQGYGYEDEWSYDDEYAFDESSEEPEFETYAFDAENVGANVYVVKHLEDIADKIEWNDELVSRLKAKPLTDEAKAKVDKSQNRISELKCEMKDFVEFAGGYSSADGSVPSKRAILARMKMADNAKQKAKQKRRQLRERKGLALGRRGMTPVQAGLNPQISRQRIEIPAKTSSMTGLTAIDNANDFDYNPIRIQLGDVSASSFDHTSSYDGTSYSNAEGTNKTRFPFLEVGAGILVGVGVVMLLKKTL